MAATWVPSSERPWTTSTTTQPQKKFVRSPATANTRVFPPHSGRSSIGTGANTLVDAIVWERSNTASRPAKGNTGSVGLRTSFEVVGFVSGGPLDELAKRLSWLDSRHHPAVLGSLDHAAGSQSHVEAHP